MLDKIYRIRKTEETCKKAFLESKWYMSVFEINSEGTWGLSDFVTGDIHEYESGEILIFDSLRFDDGDVFIVFIDKDIRLVYMAVSQLFSFEETDSSTVSFLNSDEKTLLNDFSYSEDNRFKIGSLGYYFPW